MSNWDTYKKMMSEFDQGMQFGSANKEMENQLDSINGRLNSLKATWVDIGTKVFNSDMFKGAITGLDKFSQGIESVFTGLNNLGGTPLVLTTLAAGLTGIVKAVGAIKSAGGLAAGFSAMAAGIQESVASATLLGGALTGISAIALPIAGVVALAAAWKGVSNYVSSYQNEFKNQIASSEKAMQQHKEAINGYSQQISALKSISQEYDSLSQKTNRTAAEQQRYVELTKQIAEIMPDLVSG